MKLWGANILTGGWTTTAFAATSWTELVDLGSTGTSATFTSSGTFYKYLRLGQATATGSSANYITNIEFYNCTVRTPDPNFV